MEYSTKDGVELVLDDDVRIHICHGPPRCDGKPEPCEFCEVVLAGDPRTTEEILDGMKRAH